MIGDTGPILVVDDDEMLARTIADVLALHGYEANTAATGERALTLARAIRPTVALVDLRLPDMDGLDLASRLHADSQDLQIVILTGNASVETAIRALRDEKCEYLVKPVQPETLMQVLRAADDRRRLRSTEEALQRSRNLVRAVFDASPLPIVVFDDADCVSLWNASAERLFGWTASEVLGRPISAVFGDEGSAMPAQIAGLLAAVRRGESVTGLETRLRNKSGRTLDLRRTLALLPATDGSAANVLAIYEDVTEQRRMDEALRDAQRLDQLGRLAGGISHDFNNLLAVILSQCELTMATGTLDAETRESLADIQSAAHAAADLTRQLLTFARRNPVEPSDVDVNRVIADRERLYSKLVGDGVELRLDLGHDAGTTRADRSQLEQVFANLLVNARDAMPGGGRVTLTTRRHREPRGGHPALEGREWLRVTVSDTGVGMSADVRERIFDPFFTTKERGKGTGLGLSTVYGIVQGAGGLIQVHSEPGHGTTFTIYLPRVRGVATGATAIVEEPSQPRNATAVVMVVDDQPAIRTLAARVLKREGFAVSGVARCAEALEIVQAAAAGAPDAIVPDVVIVDVHLPDGDGRELARQIHAVLPRATIVLMSGQPDSLAGLPAGMLALAKPFSVATLAGVVREAIETRGTA
jgi:PAS domain S-box-containing protein